MIRLNAKQLRELEEKKAQGEIREVKRYPIYFILENIYDTYNVGGLFRLADAITVEKIYLCGEIEIPPNHRIKKASIGTYKVVDWEYRKSARQVMEEMRSAVILSEAKNLAKRRGYGLRPRSFVATAPQDDNLNIKIIAVEQNPKAIPYTEADYSLPLALVFGNESYGVTPETLKLVDQIVEIPMWGINQSLNVIVSAAIVSYWVMKKI